MSPARRHDPSAVPPSASDHPATWKFDFPIYHPSDLAAWRAWLTANADTARGVWLASWRKASGRDRVAYADLVEEAICFGWIDSTVNILDDDRGLQLMTPRKPRSGWTRLNRRRVAALEEQGRMTDAGRRAVEAAKANGWWTIYDAVEDLIEPDDLAARARRRARRPRRVGRVPPVGPQADALVGHQRAEARDPRQPHRQDRLGGRCRTSGHGLSPRRSRPSGVSR